MNSRIIGKLIKDPERVGESNSKYFLSSEEIATPLFENKKITYRFVFDGKEELTIESADLALEQFFKIERSLKNEIAEKSFENWRRFNEAVGYLDGMETYGAVKDRPKWMERSLQNCLWLEKLKEAKEVWKYIHPIEIIVTKDRFKKNEGVYIQIICNCDWEEEHGLQIVLKNGHELIRVSEQDGNLFDYDDETQRK